MLTIVTLGLPWLMLVVTGSPIPGRLPNLDEIISTLSHRDDGTLLLGALRYLVWLVWTLWITLLLLEIVAQLRGRTAPAIPGLAGPQQLVAVLVASLGAGVLGSALSMGRGPVPPATLISLSATAATQDASAVPGAPHTQLPGAALSYRQPGQRFDGGSAEKAHQQEQTVAVRFGFDSAELSPAARQALTDAARRIASHADPARPISIVGYTDSIGSRVYNERLSTRRAHAVRDALRERLDRGYRFTTSGKGETDPVVREGAVGTSANSAARAQNRRVEITYGLKAGDILPSRPEPGHGAQGGSSAGPLFPVPTATVTPAQPVAPAVPAAPATPPAASTRPTVPETSAHPLPQPPSTSNQPVTVNLPSGAIVGLSFASGVGTALAVSRLHRRRRHRTPPGGPDLATAEPVPAPAVRTMRRADLASREAGRSDPDRAPDNGLHLFPLRTSGTLTLGTSDDEEVAVAIGGLTVGLTGPGATPAARASLLALLTHAGDFDVEILIPRGDAAQILALSEDAVDAVAEHVPALDVADDIDAALRRLEAERIHRARLLEDAGDQADLAVVRRDDPTEPLPRLVLMGTPNDLHRHRLEAIGASAEVYDMAVVMLGALPFGPTLTLDAQGQVTNSAGTDGGRWHAMRFFHLAVEEAHQILDVVRTAQGAPEPPAEDDHEPVPEAASAGPFVPVQAQVAEEPVGRVQVLGPPGLSVDDRELATGMRRTARALLTYLALHPDGATRDAVIETLWPTVEHHLAVMRFHAAVNDVRRVLRRTTGRAKDNFLVVVGDRYRIDSELLTVDLWQFQAALQKAVSLDDDGERKAALQEAADAYTGELAREQDYEWIEPDRESLRRQAIETLTHLADLHHANDESERALAVFERARNIDRYCEETYQRVMRIQAQLGRVDAVRRTYHLLETVLEDINTDPSEESQRLLNDLIRPHGRLQ